MKDNLKQQGFTIVEIVIVIIVIALIAVGGWWVYSRNVNKSDSTSTDTSEVMTTEEVDGEVPEVKSASDLKNLDTQLNSTDLGDTELSDLDQQLDF